MGGNLGDMDLFVSYDADHFAGLSIGNARLNDDVDQVRRMSQCIDLGNEIWKSFAMRVGGNVVECCGDKGAIEIDASFLSEVPEITEQYSKAVGDSVSVGIGLKLSESSKALMVSQFRGGGQMLLWHPDMQKEIDDAGEQSDTNAHKILEENLEKADRSGPTAHTSHQVGKVRGAHAGFSGYHKPGSKTASAEPDAAAVKDTIKAGHVDAAPTVSDPAVSGDMHNDFEAMLHQAAQGQETNDGNKEVANDAGGEDVKQKLVQILSHVKQQLPNLAILQQTSPDAYQSVINLVQGVILLGRQMNGPDLEQNRPIDGEEPANIQKSEDLSKAISTITPGNRVDVPSAGVAPHDYSHVLPEQHKQNGMTLLVSHYHVGNQKMLQSTLYDKHPTKPGMMMPVGHVDAYVNHKKNPEKTSIEPHSELDEQYRGKGLGMAMYEALYAHAKHKMGINRVEGGSHSADADAVHKRLSEKHGVAYRPKLRPANALSVKQFPYAKYSYTIKEEMSANLSLNEDELIGPGKGLELMCDCNHHDLTKDELEKGGMGSSGGSEAGRVHENLPVGTVKDGKVKVSHPEGGVSWAQVNSGAVQGQDAGGQPFGANSHPVSSREPNGK